MKWKRTRNELKFAAVIAMITATLISFVLVSINVGFREGFLLFWFRSWLIATLLAMFSILYIAPIVRKYTEGRKI